LNGRGKLDRIHKMFFEAQKAEPPGHLTVIKVVAGKGGALGAPGALPASLYPKP